METRQRPDFDPLGVRLDGFRLDLSGEIGGGYDSNLFGTSSNRVDDAFLDGAAAAAVTSDWSRHALGVTGSTERRTYADNGKQDWWDWSAGVFGRYDFDANTNLEARYTHQRLHLDTYAVDVQQAGISRPVPYDLDEFQVTGTTRFNRVLLTGIGAYRMVRYDDSVDFGGSTTAVSVNDFNSLLGAVGVGYALAPGRVLTLSGRLQDTNHLNSVARGRDSFTWALLAGFQYDFDGVFQGRLALGYIQRNFEGTGLKNLEGPTVEAELIWATTQLTTVTFALRRSIEESIRQNAVSYLRTLGSVRVDHELLRNVILGGELGVERRDYDQPDQSATDGVVTLSARWLLNRNVSLVGSYQYTNRFQTSGGIEDYDRNLVQLRLRLAL